MKSGRKISTVLVANRGEIAVRIIRCARDLGIQSVAVYSEADAGAQHVRLADRRVALGGNLARDTYLNQEKLLAAAVQSGADAVHPGYGFFSENAAFAQAVVDAGLVFIGPKPEVIAMMGDKHRAREIAQRSGVPVVPGTAAGVGADEIKKFGEQAGYPLMIKAVAGGSGRGMRIVGSAAEVDKLLAEAQGEAESAFKNAEVLVEKFVERPRHIEVQVFGDEQGTIVHFGERECSLQRRRQKVVEEAPAPRLHPAVRERIWTAAVNLAREVRYTGAGTMEFLVEGGEEKDSPFYFLEMNTRIQVEHPVTEAITGTDLVRLQFDVAQGEPIGLSQKDITFNGHAFEIRVYAEDSAREFRPATGLIRYVSQPSGPGVRVDTWVESGTRISAFYDSLLSKLVVWGRTRDDALERARRAMSEFVVDGLETTLGFQRWLFEREDFKRGALDIAWIEREYHGEKQRAHAVGPFRLPESPSEILPDSGETR